MTNFTELNPNDTCTCECPTYDDDLIAAAIRELVAEGLVEMVGRTAAGEPVWGLTNLQSLPPGTRFRIWVRRHMGFILILPAIIVEYVFAYTAIALAELSVEPPQMTYTLAGLAYEVNRWREGFANTETVWLSVRPED